MQSLYDYLHKDSADDNAYNYYYADRKTKTYKIFIVILLHIKY